jgi:hypothetical protein
MAVQVEQIASLDQWYIEQAAPEAEQDLTPEAPAVVVVVAMPGAWVAKLVEPI